MHRLHIRIMFLACFLLGLPQTDALAKAQGLVFVSILPQKYFIEQLAGDSLDVAVMVEPGASPATYEPKPSQMRKLANAQAYFAIGVPFERAWLPRLSTVNDQLLIVHTDQGIEKKAMPRHIHENHEEIEAFHHHVKEGQRANEHNASSPDPHIWLSPQLVKAQVRTIYRTLMDLYPEQRDVFTHNHQGLQEEIDLLHQRLSRQLEPFAGKPFMVFHPSWGYFAQEFNLQQVPIEMEGKNPKPAQVLSLIEYAQKHDIQAIFSQSQFSQKSAEIIAKEIGGKVITIDPLAEDWASNLERVGRQLAEVLQQP